MTAGYIAVDRSARSPAKHATDCGGPSYRSSDSFQAAASPELTNAGASKFTVESLLRGEMRCRFYIWAPKIASKPK